MNDHLSRFQELLREIFQFDFADLDTGIYRVHGEFLITSRPAA